MKKQISPRSIHQVVFSKDDLDELLEIFGLDTQSSLPSPEMAIPQE